MAFDLQSAKPTENSSQGFDVGSAKPFTGELDAPEEQASFLDKLAGGRGTSMLYGMASPAIAAAQMLGGEGTRKAISDFEASRERGKKALGREGFDVYSLGGSMLPATKIAGAVQRALPAATEVFGRMGVGAAQALAQGLATPSEGTQDFWQNKGTQVAASAAMGGVLPGLFWLGDKAVSGMKHIIDPYTPSGRAANLQTYRKTLLPDNDPDALPSIIKDLRAAKEIVPGSKPTALDALAYNPKATGLLAHQQQVSKMEGVSPLYTTREAERVAGRKNLLEPMARNEGAIAGENATRDTVARTKRDLVLERANIAGQQQPKLDQQLNAHTKALEEAVSTRNALVPTKPPVPPGTLQSAVDLHAPPAVPLRSQRDIMHAKILPGEIEARQAEIAKVKQSFADMEAEGLKPLKADSIIKSIRSVKSLPGFNGDAVVRDTLTDVEQELLHFQKANGTVDAYDLAMFRSQGIGNIITKLKDKQPNQRLTAGLLGHIQGKIDDAIDQAVGPKWAGRWKDYLETYGRLSKPGERLEVGQALKDALTSPLETSERGAVFANALRNQEKTVQHATGNTYNRKLEDVLTPHDMTSVQQISEELARRDAGVRLARGTSLGGGPTDQAYGGRKPLPGLIDAKLSVGNWLLDKLAGNANLAIHKQAGQEYLTPNALADALEHVPPRYRPMIEALTQHAQRAAIAGTATLAGRNRQ